MEVVLANIFLTLIGLFLIWWSLFGGKISITLNGAFPLFADSIKRWKERKKVEREVKQMLCHPIGIVLPDEAERMYRELREHVNALDPDDPWLNDYSAENKIMDKKD